MPLIDIIAGARPNFVKIAPIVEALAAHRRRGGSLRYRLVHTGQHYDALMSDVFFEQLRIPAPDLHLGARPGTQAEQTAAIMTAYERQLMERPPALCLVVGDVNSSMACALAARKMQVPLAHVEAGTRSGDRDMPEEINRLVIDAIADWYFTHSQDAAEHLRATGTPASRVFFVGNVMIDTLLKNLSRASRPSFCDELGLSPRRYLVLTLHRPENVDDAARFRRLVQTCAQAVGDAPIVFPVHPRTRQRLLDLGPLPENLHPVEPQPYLEFIWLLQHAQAVMTDSGGVTEETTALQIPCLTLRETTEETDTVAIGSNLIVGRDPAALQAALQCVFEGRWKASRMPRLWDGEAAIRIIQHLESILANVSDVLQ